MNGLRIEDGENRVQDPEADAEESLFYIRPFRKHGEALQNMPDNEDRQETGDEEK